ncbi:lantibiotic dehydratase [Streptomyces sp. NBC_00838]|uniref:lantibiotic dehydratase n=1 Tax=Streptomyces sp. NBC_00838 TaxID=2903680 RepID=UPI00386D9BB0|nr:lantibiotic dehydratase [Streptomyces sp. NBC_00838]
MRQLLGGDERRPVTSVPRRVLRYEHRPHFLLRATPYSDLELPPWPDLDGSGPEDAAGWCGWMRTVWAISPVAEAVRHASPGLAGQVERLTAEAAPTAKQARGACLSLLSYLLRLTTRTTPLGLCAGVAQGEFGTRADVRWGEEHRAVARAGGTWLAGVVTRLERMDSVRERLPVMLNNTTVVRGERLVVPFTARPPGSRSTEIDEVSMRWTAPVRSVMDLAQEPVPFGELADKLRAEYPSAGGNVRGLLDELIDTGVLITSLQPPSTMVDALGHVLAQLHQARAAEVPEAAGTVEALREIHRLMAEHSRLPVHGTAQVREQLVQLMGELSTAKHPLSLDMRLDGEVTLPRAVADQAAAAASVLTRISPHPYGTAVWREYHERFLARYGPGALVPVGDLLDPDIGLGLPHGYLGAGPAPTQPVSARDRRLMALAQQAALEGCAEVVLDDKVISDLTAGDPTTMRPPPHLDVAAEVHASSQEALQRADFQLVLTGLSRAQGTNSGGRFAALLDPGPDGVPAALSALPAANPGAAPVQLAFPALSTDATHITRTPELLPQVISIAEHRAPCPGLIQPSDLAVGADTHGLYLMRRSTGTLLEPATLHPLQPEFHTPALARFLTEVTRARSTAVTAADWHPPFTWGAADLLPFLPRIRHGSAVLSRARWLLNPADLPGRDATTAEWTAAFTAVREQRHIPDAVLLTFWGQRVRLDLTIPAHRALLRAKLDRPDAGPVTLTEAPAPGAYGWCGGRPTEIVTLLTAADSGPRPSVRLPSSRLAGRDDGHLPGVSPYLSVRLPLPAAPDSRHQFLAQHLGELADTLRQPGGRVAPKWWFTTETEHLLLTVRLPGAELHGQYARIVSKWTKRLTGRGVLRGEELTFAAYRPHAFWGAGPEQHAAEEVFATDTQAVLRQLMEQRLPDTRVLAATHFTAIATAYLGSPQAADRWLIQHLSSSPPAPALPRPVLTEARALTDPADRWKHLRSHPAGPGVISGWTARHDALRAYRAVPGPGRDDDLILNTLIHDHHHRAHGPDPDHEAVCRRLTRSAALSRTHRPATPHPAGVRTGPGAAPPPA